MSKFIIEKIDEVNLPKGMKEIQFKFTKKKGNIKIKEVKEIIDDLEEKAKNKKKKIKFMVRGQNEMRWTTIKSYIYDGEEEDDYYMDQVKDPSKFMEYNKLHITVVSQ